MDLLLQRSFFGLTGILLMQLSAALFLSITFLQTGLDKIFDYSGNKAYLTDHFKNSLLADLIPILLPVILILEILAGVLSSVGVIYVAIGDRSLSLIGAVIAMIALLCLYAGQRIGKDYAGAAGIVPYIIFTLLAIGLFSF